MHKSPLAVLLLVIGPLIAAQQPKSALAAPPAQPIASEDSTFSPSPHALLDGTPIKLRFTQPISSRRATLNQEIPLEVVENVTIDRVVVLPKGTPAVATIIATERGKTLGRPGKLGVSIHYAHLADGEKLLLRATQENTGAGRVGIMTTAIALSVFMFYPVAPVFLLTHGGNATVGKGTEITAYVQGDMHLDLSRFDPPPPLPVPDPALAGTVPLAIDSHPGGAEIEVDGALAGSTPAMLHLVPGSHKVVLKKMGFTEWTQILDISEETLRVTAQLDRESAEK
jgi:hypothetical protein